MQKSINRLCAVASLTLAFTGMVTAAPIAAPIPISNFSFETAYSPDNSLMGIGNWSQSAGPAGGSGALGGLTPTDGSLFLFVNGPDEGGPGVVYQRLNVLQAGTYTFQVDVGFRTDVGAEATYDVAFYAVNPATESNDATLARETVAAPVAGTWETKTFTFTVEGTESWFASGVIQITLTTPAGVQVAYDNIRGTFAPSGPAVVRPPGSQPTVDSPLRLEGKFGVVEINPSQPGLATLTLRRPDGELEPRSLLSDPQWPWLVEGFAWAHGACTYVRDMAGTLYDSRHAKPSSVESDGTLVTMKGITLRDKEGGEPVASEDWKLQVEGDGLVWTVQRTWLKPFTTRLEGSPALFFSMRGLGDKPTAGVPNGVVSTLWVEPDRLAGRHDSIYRPAQWGDFHKWPRNNVQWLTDPDAWAIHKLFGNWDNASDLRLDPKGGHLYRRGSFGWITETGIVTQPEAGAAKTSGQIETTTLRIAPVDKRTTGYQMAVNIPDKPLQERLQSFYSSLLNGGVVNDQLNYNFGNETDGWYYAGSLWMQGLALSVGTPAAGPLSHASFDVARAFRKHLAHVVGSLGPDGRSFFGYNHLGATVDDNIHATIGMAAYYFHSGDMAFMKQHLPILEQMLEIYLSRRNKDGLFDMGAKGHQYYDVVPISGVSSYHNAFFYRALRDMAQLQRAAGDAAKATHYDQVADEVKAAFNRVLWAEDAPDGPRYLDWITHTGEKVTYCSDVSQFPAIAFGIASPEQASKTLATIDRRIEELKKSHSYAEMSSLSAYWPQPPHLQFNVHTFPLYMNGGGFLAQTYWEIMARARAGDKKGALHRLKRFAEGSAKLNWVGTNWVQINGEIGLWAAYEPYLSDMIVVNAALIHGILGIQPSEKELVIQSRAPESWPEASATILDKGKLKLVTFKNGAATVSNAEGPGFIAPATLTWDVSSAGPLEQEMIVSRYWDSGPGWTADATIAMDNGGGLRLRRATPPGTLLGSWDFRKAQPNFVSDESTFGNPARLASGTLMTQQITDGASAGMQMAGATSVTVGGGEGPLFIPKKSFSVKARFQTSSDANGVLAGRSGVFSLGIKNGRLSAWLMSKDGTLAEATGSTPINDGAWHDAEAIFDFETMKLSLLVDGKLDIEDGEPAGNNPVDFGHLPDLETLGSQQAAVERGNPWFEGFAHQGKFGPLTLGSLNGVHFFTGILQSVSILSGVPSDANSGQGIQYEPKGTYGSQPFNWNQPVTVTELVTDSTLNDGTIEAVVELSGDNFSTVAETIPLLLKGGKERIKLLPKSPSKFVRVRFLLAAADAKKQTPVVRSFLLAGSPSLDRE